MYFDHAGCALPVPADLGELFRHTWDELATPGNGWTGTEKVAIAQTARKVRQEGADAASPAPDEHRIIRR